QKCATTYGQKHFLPQRTARNISIRPGNGPRQDGLPGLMDDGPKTPLRSSPLTPMLIILAYQRGSEDEQAISEVGWW
ncbi:hypothetical protein, partial [Klebsiella michiganensis]|uniref:hypothetical protein n=1 Tax=Klebsiella michiganensis TaxID=1134687 RepID=UPI0031D4479A